MAKATGGTAGRWSTRMAFIFAGVGTAVGLGNLWRFPYVAGENGGGAFVLFYILCVLLIGLPLLSAELFIGRRGRLSAIGSVSRLAAAEGRSRLWALQSWIGMIGTFVILTFYSVVAGWVIAFAVLFGADLFREISAHGFAGLAAGAFAGADGVLAGAQFAALLAHPWRVVFYHGVFMALTVLIVSRGLKGGIEAATSILMPAFFAMLLALVVFALFKGDAARGLDFIFGVRLLGSESGGETMRGLAHGLADGSLITAAMGQAFFSLGLGQSLMMTYGAYMKDDQNIPRAALLVVLSDTLAGILAGVAIFPIVFKVGLDPTAGPALMFQTLPAAFQAMPAGALFGFVFFLLAFFAAITSSISILEATTLWLNEQAGRDRRVLFTCVAGAIAFALGVPSALSQVPLGTHGEHANWFNEIRPLSALPQFRNADGSGMDLLSFLSALADYVLPIAGFITAIFAGWIVSSSASREELGFKSERWYRRWRFLIRYVCPAAIGAVIVYPLVIAPFLAK